jgi:hypothetical protein
MELRAFFPIVLLLATVVAEEGPEDLPSVAEQVLLNSQQWVENVDDIFIVGKGEPIFCAELPVRFYLSRKAQPNSGRSHKLFEGGAVYCHSASEHHDNNYRLRPAAVHTPMFAMQVPCETTDSGHICSLLSKHEAVVTRRGMGRDVVGVKSRAECDGEVDHVTGILE